MNVTLDVVFFNYFNRFIFDAFIDGEAGGVSPPYPDTGGSTVSGVKLKLGSKTVTWRLDGPKGMPRNGEKVVARNKLELVNVRPDAAFLAVHIYPDETVELIPSVHYPQETEKGVAMANPGHHAAVSGRRGSGCSEDLRAGARATPSLSTTSGRLPAYQNHSTTSV